jgi:hypothetical protein
MRSAPGLRPEAGEEAFAEALVADTAAYMALSDWGRMIGAVLAGLFLDEPLADLHEQLLLNFVAFDSMSSSRVCQQPVACQTIAESASITEKGAIRSRHLCCPVGRGGE